MWTLDYIANSQLPGIREIAEESRKALQVIKAVVGDSKSADVSGHLILLSLASTKRGDVDADERYLAELLSILSAIKARGSSMEYPRLMLQAAYVAF